MMMIVRWPYDAVLAVFNASPEHAVNTNSVKAAHSNQLVRNQTIEVTLNPKQLGLVVANARVLLLAVAQV